MNWYKFNFKAYWEEIYGLPDAEDLAYRRLMDLYYETEGPISADAEWLERNINLTWDCIEPVLLRFFLLRDDTWVHEAWQKDINTRLQVRENNRKAGRIGGKNKKGLRKAPESK